MHLNLLATRDLLSATHDLVAHIINFVEIEGDSLTLISSGPELILQNETVTSSLENIEQYVYYVLWLVGSSRGNQLLAQIIYGEVIGAITYVTAPHY